MEEQWSKSREFNFPRFFMFHSIQVLFELSPGCSRAQREEEWVCWGVGGWGRRERKRERVKEDRQAKLK